ncbi:MAG: hypothetical protein HSCHL_0968 [Hydrogenibacillus schlegelii]|uniref:Uncharacterized protein n=1 Tax=Hydrogenibacillus schlegelii TaxID=1484 RepID=A0A2T5G6U8_HYDSH|nr:hypothetical protein [Hydrogenibacillus schlegelii]PTQ51892.1 MAG: hypothetical protein HSCHL_0968 [Hydrogenibacillus schlegelii]
MDRPESWRIQTALKTFEKTPERLYRIYRAVRKAIPDGHLEKDAILDMMENAFLDVEAAADAMIEAFGKRGERPDLKKPRL